MAFFITDLEAIIAMEYLSKEGLYMVFNLRNQLNTLFSYKTQRMTLNCSRPIEGLIYEGGQWKVSYT